MNHPLFITATQLANMLGLDRAATFLRRRATLERETLFPAPMPTTARPLRWRRDEVMAWIERHGRPVAPPPVIAGDNVVLLDMARRP